MKEILEAVRRTVERHWELSFPVLNSSVALSPIKTFYAGEPGSAGDGSAWAELWVTPQDERAERTKAIQRQAYSIVVHLFARDVSDLRTVERMVDEGRAALRHVRLELQSPSTNEPIGHLSIREPETRDLSREESPEISQPMRHLVLLFPAIAELTHSLPTN